MIKNYNTRSRDFFSSKAWNQVKENYLEEKCHLCEICSSEKKLVLAVDVYLRGSPSRFNLDDPDPERLVAVCRTHRKKLHQEKRRRAAHV